MNDQDVIDEINEYYSEWLEMLEPPEAISFVVDQLVRRVVQARNEAEHYKMALKRMELMK